MFLDRAEETGLIVEIGEWVTQAVRSTGSSSAAAWSSTSPTRPTRSTAQAVIGPIHGLRCQAVGEGVETAAQAEILRVSGGDVVQGYAIALPMDEDAFLAWSRGSLAIALAG